MRMMGVLLSSLISTYPASVALGHQCRAARLILVVFTILSTEILFGQPTIPQPRPDTDDGHRKTDREQLPNAKLKIAH